MDRRKGKPAVILLAEDDPGDRDLAIRALREDVIKAELHVVSNGEAALDYLNQRGEYADPRHAPRPDLMLLDLNMPRVDGKEVLREMRQHPVLRRVPVVVLTTSQQEEDIIRSYDLGCNSFITKPVGIDSFINMVRDLGLYWFELVALPAF